MPAVVPGVKMISVGLRALSSWRTDSRADFVMRAAFHRETMAGAMDVAVVMLVGLDHRVDHLLRSLRGGGVVEIDERAALAEHRVQDRKIAADGGDVERRGSFGLAGDERGGQQRLRRVLGTAVAGGRLVGCRGFSGTSGRD